MGVSFDLRGSETTGRTSREIDLELEAGEMERIVQLLNRMNGDTHLHLWARINDAGDFSIEGQDLGSMDESGDSSEYEWILKVDKSDVPSLVVLLGGTPEQHVLDIIEKDWAPKEGSGLERLVRESGIPFNTAVWRS
jgi:hypothetical protein